MNPLSSGSTSSRSLFSQDAITIVKVYSCVLLYKQSRLSFTLSQGQQAPLGAISSITPFRTQLNGQYIFLGLREEVQTSLRGIAYSEGPGVSY